MNTPRAAKGMKTAAALPGAVALVVALGIGGDVTASASPVGARFGSEQQFVDTDASVAGYNVMDLKPSGSNVLSVPLTGNVPVTGQLWYAPIAVTAVRGSVIPEMQSFNARTPDGRNYRMLDQTLAPDLGVSPMDEGQRTAGNIYFDVTGPPPTAVVYTDGAQDRLTWSAEQ